MFGMYEPIELISQVVVFVDHIQEIGDHVFRKPTSASCHLPVEIDGARHLEIISELAELAFPESYVSALLRLVDAVDAIHYTRSHLANCRSRNG